MLSVRDNDDLLNFIDGKPLVIGKYSAVPDAANGPATPIG